MYFQESVGKLIIKKLLLYLARNKKLFSPRNTNSMGEIGLEEYPLPKGIANPYPVVTASDRQAVWGFTRAFIALVKSPICNESLES